MSKELEAQQELVLMISKLVTHVYVTLGWRLTYGDAYRDPRCPYGAAKSLHRRRLAVDFNLFVNGEYIDGTKSHHLALWTRLGEFWESIGGTWGGRFLGVNKGDFNHFSHSIDQYM